MPIARSKGVLGVFDTLECRERRFARLGAKPNFPVQFLHLPFLLARGAPCTYENDPASYRHSYVMLLKTWLARALFSSKTSFVFAPLFVFAALTFSCFLHPIASSHRPPQAHTPPTANATTFLRLRYFIFLQQPR